MRDVEVARALDELRWSTSNTSSMTIPTAQWAHRPGHRRDQTRYPSCDAGSSTWRCWPTRIRCLALGNQHLLHRLAVVVVDEVDEVPIIGRTRLRGQGFDGVEVSVERRPSPILAG